MSLKRSEIAVMIDRQGYMRPYDDDSNKKFLKMQNKGREVPHVLYWKEARSLPYHNRYFKMLQTVFDAQEYWDDFDAFREHTLCSIRWCETHVNVFDKSVKVVAKSIAFDKCSQDEFIDIHRKTVTFFMKQYCLDKNMWERIRAYD
jgi:hypothetical protein